MNIQCFLYQRKMISLNFLTQKSNRILTSRDKEVIVNIFFYDIISLFIDTIITWMDEE
jgi:hypothetical protein